MTNNQPVILVADDDPDFNYLMQYVIKKSDIAAKARFVSDGQAALDYLQGLAGFADRELFPLPDMAVLDMKMPFVPGLEVLKWIRQQPEFSGMPVMIISASLDGENRQKSTGLGANAYCTKSGDPADLVRAVRDFYEKWH